MRAQQDIGAVAAALAAPFDPGLVRFKPAAVSGRRALALAYVDARAVLDRLDDVLGVAGWQDEYRLLDGGSVLCRLTVLLNGRWFTKSDVGGPGGQTGEADRCKAAVSDALKRAAVKFGVGRYLYRLPPQWVDYDPRAKQLLTRPRLPAWALPPVPDDPTPVRGPGEGVPDTAGRHIDEGQRRELLRLLAAKGYGAGKLAERYGVRELAELTPAQYRHAAGSLARLPDRVVAR